MSENEKSLDLIVRYLNDPENDILQKEMQQFRSTSVENEAFFIETASIWKQAESAAVLDKVELAHSVSRFGDALSVDTAIKGRSSKRIWLVGLAASLLVVAFGYWLYVQSQTPTYRYKITTNSIDSVQLGDGSKIKMAKHSKLSYPDKFAGLTREVSLINGQAFFDITKEKQRPFKVKINESDVTVLGTSFNINLTDSTIILGVKTGRVLFSPYKNAVASVLTAGQGLTYDVAKKELRAKNIQNQDAWITNELVFVDTPLEEVCKELSTYYNIEIKLRDDIHKSKKLNARFKDQALDDVLTILSETYSIQIRKEHNQINLITPKQIN